jgi:enoyl-CoA hydratase/carnithine racemase
MAVATVEFKTLLYEADDRVAVITLNRPDKMNALSLELCAEMRVAVRTADQDPEVRVVVIKGAGDRAFSAGYDLTDSVELQGSERGIDNWNSRLNHDLDFTYSVWNCSKPVIAMINGYCLAGGLEFAQMCDIRYASEDSRFAVIETRFSNGVATLAMPWIIGPLARELIYTGDMIDAATALRIGLVNRVFPKADVEAETMKIAKRMSRVALAALQWNKRAINNTFETMGFHAALKYGVEVCSILDGTETPEYQEFNTRRRGEGLQAALAWRRELFAPYE